MVPIISVYNNVLSAAALSAVLAALSVSFLPFSHMGYYNSFELLATLELGLGDAFTAEVRDAWSAVYGVVESTMIAGAEYETKATAEAAPSASVPA